MSPSRCRDYGQDPRDLEYYLMQQTDIKCWVGEHYKWAFPMGAPILLLGNINFFSYKIPSFHSTNKIVIRSCHY